MTPRTPLVLIAGGLGSGKTTLLRRLLTDDAGRVAVLVNEFGELGIDGERVAGAHIDMVEITGGCVCCSLAGEFRDAVCEMIERFDPERIVVETTGVAEADALVMDVEDELEQARIEAVVMLVDADASARFPQMGHTERSQLETADLILLNKADLVDAEQMRRLRQRVVQINPRARTLETVHADIPLALLVGDMQRLGASGKSARRAREHGHGMTSFQWHPPGGLDRACFEAAVASWPDALYRAKGRVVLDGQCYQFDYVAGRWDLSATDQAQPGLVFIGPDLEAHREAIVGGLEDCRG